MLTDEQYALIDKRLVYIYQNLENYVISDIAKRIERAGRWTESAEMIVNSMREQGFSPAEIQAKVLATLNADAGYQKYLAENTLAYKRGIIKEVAKARGMTYFEALNAMQNAADFSFNADMRVWEQAGKELIKDSEFLAQIVLAFRQQLGDELMNITKSMGFEGTNIKTLYQRKLDEAIIKIATGAAPARIAQDEAIKELAQSGLRIVTYQTNASRSIESAVRLATRTAATQLTGKISMNNAERMGEDLVEVTAHWGARSDGSRSPSDHAFWQGKIYSISGNSNKYPKLSVATGYPDNPLGLKGYNCRHDFYTYFDGVSTKAKIDPEPKPKQYNGKEYTYYQATQVQRNIERNIRALKAEIAGRNAINENADALKLRLRTLNSQYKNFSNTMGISVKPDRIRYIPLDGGRK